MVTNKNINKRKILIILLLVVLVIGSSIAAYFYTKSDQGNGQLRAPNSVSYQGPTAEEKAAGDDQKKANEIREDIDSNAKPATSANIVLVDANQYDGVIEVRGYISNVYEDGGICKAVFTNGSTTVTRSSTAFKDATTTQCGAINVSRSDFTNAGVWNLTLSYTGSSSQGEVNSKLDIK